jgi:toxin ParE1/3/4
MRLRYTARAAQDLAAIADYLMARNPAAARAVRDAILRSLRMLVSFPEIGRRQTIIDVRKLVTRRYPYIVYYRVDRSAKEIVILTIQHPAQQREYSNT